MQHLYYVSKSSQDDGWHIVHTAHCEYLPSESRRCFLGVYICCVDAVKEARLIYNRTKGCIYCCRL